MFNMGSAPSLSIGRGNVARDNYGFYSWSC